MAKSKLVTINKKIAGQVVTGFQQINDAVTGNHQKIESLFIDRYLSRDGESISDARMRLQREKKLRKNQ